MFYFLEWPNVGELENWKVSSDKFAGNTPAKLNRISDGHWGKVLQVDATYQDRVEFQVENQARYGQIVRFAAKQTKNSESRFYITLSLQSMDTETIQGAWLNFPIGNGKAYSHRSSSFEWVVPIQAEHHINDWMILEVNLPKIVKNTFGKSGWEYHRLKGFRISTQNQHPALQIDGLKEAGCERIFEEKASGAQRDRFELKTALDYMRSGDTIVVWKLDRLARSRLQLIAIVEDLHAEETAE